MGISTSNTYYVYSRDGKTEVWNKEPLVTYDQVPFGQFKHLVCELALQATDEYSSYKAIYLYRNYTRLIKAELQKPSEDSYYKLILTCCSEKVANEWDVEEEVKPSSAHRFREYDFNRQYVVLDSDYGYQRRWQLIKPHSSYKPHPGPKISFSDYIKTLY